MPDDHKDHVSVPELDRALAGVNETIKVGFDGIHRRLDETNHAVREVTTTMGTHAEKLVDLNRRFYVQEKRSLGVASTPGPIAAAAAAADDDTKAALTFGDLKRLATAGRIVWPLVAGVGSAIAAWMAAQWTQ
jgi:hypothetical protein